MILDIIGISCGLISLNERDIYITPAIVAIALNSLVILGWIIMIIIAIVG